MNVRALNSFVGRTGGRKLRIQEGQVFELPHDVDWLTAGLVVEVKVPTPTVEVESPPPKRRRKT